MPHPLNFHIALVHGPQVYTRVSGQPIQYARSTCEAGVAELHIQDALPEDHCTYTCLAENALGQVSCSSRVTVRELSEDPELQPVLAGLFLSMCLVTVLGNLLIILAVSPDSHLHTPMYFFLSNLSLPDIGFTSTTVPKMIVDIQSHSRVVSYAGCLTQMSLFAIFGGMEERHAPACDGL
nr:olfactory receptor 7E24-like [Pongo abelii]